MVAKYFEILRIFPLYKVMSIPRIIPVLLLKNKGLVKSTAFKKHRYLGDCMNAVKLFNDFKAHELIFLDIDASREKRCIDLELVKEIGEEAHMPFGVGGGITTIQQIQDILSLGAEKVVLGSVAATAPDFISRASAYFGASTISVCMDVKRNLFGKYKVCYSNAQKVAARDPMDFAREMENLGAGELIVQSVDLDGTQQGYDLGLIKEIAQNVSIPVVALGGANDLTHAVKAYCEGYASAVAGASMFVYQGKQKGVLISYPNRKEIEAAFS